MPGVPLSGVSAPGVPVSGGNAAAGSGPSVPTDSDHEHAAPAPDPTPPQPSSAGEPSAADPHSAPADPGPVQPGRAEPPRPGPGVIGPPPVGPFPGAPPPYRGGPPPGRPSSGQRLGQGSPGQPFPGRPGGPWGPHPGPPPYPPGPHGGAPAVASGPPPRAPHRWGFPAYLLAEAVFLGVSALLGAVLITAGTAPGVGTLAVLLGVPTICSATVAIVATKVRGNGPKIDLALRWSWRDVGIGALFGIGGLLLTVPASLVYIAIVGAENANSAVGDVFEHLRATPAQAVLVFLLVALVGPICEEIVYRGLLWGATEKHGANRWLAFALTTIIFALAHFEFTRTPLLLVVAIPIGLARAVTGTITASIVAHQINNLLPALALALSLLGTLPGTT
ncbi:Abortive infection protein [Pseudonocardia dioxanivorans CB1190]|uniref:Abortive infection protein n=1 Tax=Pseudonocardia dioxanivorans (strain ATCC 55486 / DSM 44775 / JCM 13855 / CB1190) TaxID=675635 RepID=F4D1I2_PSEUX|nr:Abortive infection protein [Pseudonocardia dioxanivorans CB1190]GJF01919.1 hypothetical protein PSD17_08830 [Pseudonocardia sp. D17]